MILRYLIGGHSIRKKYREKIESGKIYWLDGETDQGVKNSEPRNSQ